MIILEWSNYHTHMAAIQPCTVAVRTAAHNAMLATFACSPSHKAHGSIETNQALTFKETKKPPRAIADSAAL